MLMFQLLKPKLEITMKMKRSKIKTCIEDLPNELLCQIFACLSFKHDLDSVQRVSKRWFAVVDETIGRDVVITSLASDDVANVVNDDFPYAYMGCLGFNMISKMGVKTCHVKLTSNCGTNATSNEDDCDEENGSRDENMLPQSFKYPHLIMKLNFSGKLSSYIFRTCLKGTENLAHLEIDLMALSQVTPRDLQNLQLPRLKALGIGKCANVSGQNIDDTLGLPQLQSLLQKNTFPKLSKLDLCFPFQECDTLKALFIFLGVHVVLAELYIILEFPVQVSSIRSFSEEHYLDLMNLIKVHPNRNSLKICDIQAIQLHGRYPQLAVWHRFLEQQHNLKSLTLRLGYITNDLLKQICTKNQHTLAHIFLYKLNETQENEPGVARVATVLDCSVFSCVTRLETLYAIGCDFVTNGKSLPGSISSLFLTGALTLEDATHILMTLSNLQFVCLKNASFGTNAQYGINLELLKRFIMARKVRRLILNGTSLNEEYPTQGLSNVDPKYPSYLKMFEGSDEENMYLDWELDTITTYYMDKSY